jgi:hypothetical protein
MRDERKKLGFDPIFVDGIYTLRNEPPPSKESMERFLESMKEISGEFPPIPLQRAPHLMTDGELEVALTTHNEDHDRLWKEHRARFDEQKSLPSEQRTWPLSAIFRSLHELRVLAPQLSVAQVFYNVIARIQDREVLSPFDFGKALFELNDETLRQELEKYITEFYKARSGGGPFLPPKDSEER